MNETVSTFYPVVIPTLNRYEHLRRCVESLARNTHAEQTELVVGLDFPPAEKYVEGHRRIKEYLPTVSGFKKVTVFEHEKNLGSTGNCHVLQDYVYANYDAMIFSEDDNEFAPCFLDYMNKCLNHFKGNPRIASVSAFLPQVYHGLTDRRLLFTLESNAWGMGTWRNETPPEAERGIMARSVLSSFRSSWKSFTSFPASFRMLLNMAGKGITWGDVARTQVNILQNRYQVRPSVTLCRNWGNDGSGIHCKVVNDTDQQSVSQERLFQFTETDAEPIYLPQTARATRLHNMPEGRCRRMLKLCWTAVLYLKYRLS